MDLRDVEAVVGDRVDDGEGAVSSVTRDWWPLAWVQQSSGDELERPAAVARPRTTQEVQRLLSWASSSGTPITVRGGGSGVCGGAKPTSGALVLDTTGLDDVELDAGHRLVTVGAGVYGGELEAQLAREGLTLGHLPQSIDISTVGGWINTSSAGQMSPGYGFIEDRVVAVTAVLGDATLVEIKPTARSAVGPDLRRLLIGSEGRLAVVTRVTLACSPAVQGFRWQAYRFDSFEQTWRLADRVWHSGAGPSVLRGWDAVDADAAFGSIEEQSGPVGLVGFETTLPGVEGRADAVARVAAELGGRALDPVYGQHWWDHRLGAVQTFERVLGPERAWGDLTILDTVEVSATWPDLADTYRAMTDAIGARAAWVRCHFSHVFRAGLALYFSFAVEGEDRKSMEAAYRGTWDAAMEACVASGAAASHHHGMGRLKASYTEADLGPGATELLRRVRRVCDPAGILNRGVLLP